MPACISNQTAHSNAICTVVTDPTEAILQAMVLLLYFMALSWLYAPATSALCSRHLASDPKIIIISLGEEFVAIDFN